MFRQLLLLATAVCVVGGCQRIEVHPSVYDAQGIHDVKTWYVGFTYFGGAETETASKMARSSKRPSSARRRGKTTCNCATISSSASATASASARRATGKRPTGQSTCT